MWWNIVRQYSTVFENAILLLTFFILFPLFLSFSLLLLLLPKAPYALFLITHCPPSLSFSLFFPIFSWISILLFLLSSPLFLSLYFSLFHSFFVYFSDTIRTPQQQTELFQLSKSSSSSHAHTHPDRHTHIQTDTQTDRQTDRQTYTQTDTQTGRQAICQLVSNLTFQANSLDTLCCCFLSSIHASLPK